ncbi:MAG: TonB system transport protein ExbD, partial [Allorhizobium sp.]
EVMNLLRDAGYLKIALVGLEAVAAVPAPDAAAATEPVGPAP